MPVLTKKLGIPSHFSSTSKYQYGIGLSTDGQQSYFYCCVSSTQHHVCETTDSSIFRLKISGQLHSSNNWEFVGKVDFLCEYNTISPCGKYFWSIERKLNPDQLIFRLVNIKTLEYEIFETTELYSNTFSVNYLRIYYTSHSGTFLIIGRWLDEGIYDEIGDMVFRFHVNENQKFIQLEQLHFPNIPTVEPLAYVHYSNTCHKRFSYGIFEDSFSLFFYQIDYFGDLFVLEWSDRPLEWTKFTVEGDQFETWMSTEDRDLSNRQPRNTFNGWSYAEYKVLNNHRFYFENGYFCCTCSFDDDKQKTHFYHCDFNIETRVCRSKRIFSTYDYFLPKYNDLILSKNNGLEMLFLCNRNEYIFCSDKRVIFWEQIVLNGIPTLLSLTYLAVSRMVEEKKKKAVSLSMENAESMTVPSVENNAIDQPVYKKSILQRFQRLFAKKKRKTPFPINEHTEPKPKMVIELESNICKEKESTICSIVTYSQVNDLLNEINNILV